MTAIDAVRRRHLPTACLALALPLALGVGVPAQAHVLDRADGRWLRIDILDRASGRPLPMWRHDGELWIAGTPGARYAVRLVNRSGERLLAVVAVDGVNVVSGETASAGQRGYVLSPWGRAALTGWRKSEREVAAFEFTALADSYAARTGRPDDVGVIGVAVFRERPQPIAAAESPPAEPPRAAESAPAEPPAAQPPRAAASPAPASPGADRGPSHAAEAQGDASAAREVQPAAGERLGTGHGAREFSEAVTVPFERASRAPQELLRIRYDSLENLVAAGIAPRSFAWAGRPRPFPADDGFVPDPPGP